jgi:integrase
LRRRLKDQFPGGLCAYLFRHTYATDALENGVDPITVAELLGHKDTTMVSRVYQHLSQRVEHMRQAAQRVRPVNSSASTTNGNPAIDEQGQENASG